MKISIIGSGKVGSALARGWHKAGHDITFGVRDVTKFAGDFPGIRISTIPEAAQTAETLVISAVPKAVQEIAHSLGDLQGKILIDTMNSVGVKPAPYNNTTDALAALTNCRDIVKCFNTTGFENMGNPKYGTTAIDMFYAGDSPQAKEVAKQLAIDLGFENVYDFGGKEKFELLESFALCWINLAIVQGYGRDMAFKIIRRGNG